MPLLPGWADLPSLGRHVLALMQIAAACICDCCSFPLRAEKQLADGTAAPVLDSLTVTISPVATCPSGLTGRGQNRVGNTPVALKSGSPWRRLGPPAVQWVTAGRGCGTGVQRDKAPQFCRATPYLDEHQNLGLGLCFAGFPSSPPSSRRLAGLSLIDSGMFYDQAAIDQQDWLAVPRLGLASLLPADGSQSRLKA